MMRLMTPRGFKSVSPASMAAMLLSARVLTLWSPPGSQPKLKTMQSTDPGAA